MLRIILIIVTILLVIFGIFKMAHKEDRAVGYISFIFSVIVFIISQIPFTSSGDGTGDLEKSTVRSVEQQYSVESNNSLASTISDNDSISENSSYSLF